MTWDSFSSTVFGVLGYGRHCLRRACSRSRPRVYISMSYPVEGVEWVRAETGLCHRRGCGLCSGQWHFDAVCSRPRVSRFQVARDHLLRCSSLVPNPHGPGGPKLLSRMVQIVQKREQSTQPFTGRSRRLARVSPAKSHPGPSYKTLERYENNGRFQG